jgi:hypothetical protein
MEVSSSQEQPIPQQSDRAGSSSGQATVCSDRMLQVPQDSGHYVGRHRARQFRNQKPKNSNVIVAAFALSWSGSGMTSKIW